MKIIQKRNGVCGARSARGGFTLIELLVVISIMAILAAFTVSVLHGVAVTKYRNQARAEMHELEAALEAYKAQCGVYPPGNANPQGTYSPPPGQIQTNTTLPQLYYELCGVSPDSTGTVFTNLDGSAKITSQQALAAFGVGGFVNCTKGSGDDAVPARNFLLGLKQTRIGSVTDNGVLISNIITSVRGPDVSYKPLGVADVNPFRYLNPGINNPKTYDLWVELVISGKTNLICNWNNAAIINSGLP
jgi:prepilin-type N-terminal cleavage/methylation domain-containing protein